MQIENLDSKDKVIIVAEIGNNHEGSFSLAKKLIDEAAQAGVDAVKFQTYKSETRIPDLNHDIFKILKKINKIIKNSIHLSIT